MQQARSNPGQERFHFSLYKHVKSVNTDYASLNTWGLVFKSGCRSDLWANSDLTQNK